MNQCAAALADSLEQEARALVDEASALTTGVSWSTSPMAPGFMTQTIAGEEMVAGATGEAVNEVNAGHAKEHDGVTKAAALDLLRRNSSAAAAAIRALSDEEVDQANLC